MSKNDRGQSNLLGCAVQWDAKPHEVMPLFDDLPWQTRKAVRNSPFKLCVACVEDYGSNVAAVRQLEEEIREVLVEFDREGATRAERRAKRARNKRLKEAQRRLSCERV